MAWSDHAPRLDMEVDEHLGDDIQLAVDGINFIDVKGFAILPTEALGGLSPLDGPLGSTKRAKLNKALFLNERPPNTTRLRCPLLGPGTFKPGNSDPDEQGRYWIFDVQKA